MKIKDVQKLKVKKVMYTSRVTEETNKYLRKNRIDLDKVVELLKKEGSGKE